MAKFQLHIAICFSVFLGACKQTSSKKAKPEATKDSLQSAIVDGPQPPSFDSYGRLNIEALAFDTPYYHTKIPFNDSNRTAYLAGKPFTGTIHKSNLEESHELFKERFLRSEVLPGDISIEGYFFEGKRDSLWRYTGIYQGLESKITSLFEIFYSQSRQGENSIEIETLWYKHLFKGFSKLEGDTILAKAMVGGSYRSQVWIDTSFLANGYSVVVDIDNQHRNERIDRDGHIQYFLFDRDWNLVRAKDHFRQLRVYVADSSYSSTGERGRRCGLSENGLCYTYDKNGQPLYLCFDEVFRDDYGKSWAGESFTYFKRDARGKPYANDIWVRYDETGQPDTFHAKAPLLDTIGPNPERFAKYDKVYLEAFRTPYPDPNILREQKLIIQK